MRFFFFWGGGLECVALLLLGAFGFVFLYICWCCFVSLLVFGDVGYRLFVFLVVLLFDVVCIVVRSVFFLSFVLFFVKVAFLEGRDCGHLRRSSRCFKTLILHMFFQILTSKILPF